MTLWDRIERWRESAKSLEIICGNNEAEAAYYYCARELEADLRELSEIVERVQHEMIVNGIQVCTPQTCPRCALEARIGRPG